MPKTFFAAIAKLGPPPPVFTSFNIGTIHAQGIKSNSTNWIWGYNNYGQLGTSNNNSYWSPTTPSGGLVFVDVSAGNFNSFGVTSGGTGYAWGLNDSGSLGIGLAAAGSRQTPTAICGGIVFRQIRAGFDSFAIGISTTGVAYGWGNGLEGKLGRNSTVSSSVPVAVCGGLNLCRISVGISHTLALTSAGVAYGWGNNTSGKLGDNSITNRSTPVAVCGGLNFCFINASSSSFGITSTGVLYGWGANDNGMLGNNSVVSQRTPVAVCGGLTWSMVSSWPGGTIGLTTDGKIYTWGRNTGGFLGTGDILASTLRSTPAAVCPTLNFRTIATNNVNQNAGPTALAVTTDNKIYAWGGSFGFLAGVPVFSTTPFNLETNYSFCKIAAFDNPTAVYLDSNGVPYSTGDNSFFRRGNGTTAGRIPTPIGQLLGGQSFTEVSAGGNHGCGINFLKLAYCWGSNAAAQLGDNSTISKSTPVAVCGGLSFNKIACGTNNTYAITTTGVGYAWGIGTSGAIGDNTIGAKSTPVAICGGLNLCQISASLNLGCGITSSGAAYCWGLNTSGQLGDNSIVNKSTPVLVTGGYTFGVISCGGSQVAALTTTGVGYAWGVNNAGVLGINSLVSRSVPTAICGGHTFCRISMGSSHACALTNLGVAYCWGSNNGGNMGNNNSTINYSTPVAVCGGHTFCAISIGSNYTVAITNTGQVYHWGQNTSYQFGMLNYNPITPNLISNI